VGPPTTSGVSQPKFFFFSVRNPSSRAAYPTRRVAARARSSPARSGTSTADQELQQRVRSGQSERCLGSNAVSRRRCTGLGLSDPRSLGSPYPDDPLAAAGWSAALTESSSTPPYTGLVAAGLRCSLLHFSGAGVLDVVLSSPPCCAAWRAAEGNVKMSRDAR
jgi:hypothetical protein